MERSKSSQEDALYETLGVALDDEDTENLFYDCHAFLSQLLERSNPKWVASDGAKLLHRLEETLNWYRIH